MDDVREHPCRANQEISAELPRTLNESVEVQCPGEPLAGLIVQKREEYEKDWKWDGYAVIVAPDFLHSFGPADTCERCDELFESLKSLGYETREKEIVERFQSEHGLEPTGVLDWRTILVIDSLCGPEDRPRLSGFVKTFVKESGK